MMANPLDYLHYVITKNVGEYMHGNATTVSSCFISLLLLFNFHTLSGIFGAAKLAVKLIMPFFLVVLAAINIIYNDKRHERHIIRYRFMAPLKRSRANFLVWAYVILTFLTLSFYG